MLIKILNTLSSLKLTVVLLLSALLLVFFGTLDQVNFGIYEVQRRYFQSLMAFWSYPVEWWGGSFLKFITIPLPGGGLLGGLLLINLMCAHFKYFIFSWKKIGIALIHTGIVVLLIAGFLIGFFQQEFRMALMKGERANFAENIRENELVVIDKTDTKSDTVWSITENLLKNGATIALPTLGMEVKVEAFYENAVMGKKQDNPKLNLFQATEGVGRRMDLIVYPRPKTYSQNESNIATAYVTVKHQGKILGTWLVSNAIDEKFPPQTFTVGQHHYEIALRFKREYFPFYLELLDFKHEKYPGTEVAKNFASEVRIINDNTQTDRNVLIYMNHPLRYEGYTFYQGSFSRENKDMSILQVVKNPVRLIPYVGVWLTSVGLVLHFCIQLWIHSRKKGRGPL